MLFAAAFVLGAIGGSAAWDLLKTTLAKPAFERTNYRGHDLVCGSGIAVVLGAWSLAAIGGVVGRLELIGGRSSLLLVVTGFGLVGLIDDVGGVGESGGFRAHLNALRDRRLTTGAVKMLGGPLVALAALASGYPHPVDLLRVAALVSLAANLFNLMDRAPGRVVKVSLLWLAGVVIAAFARSGDVGSLAPIGGIIGVGAGLLRSDLREESMLGDVGANALGAAAGVGLVAVLDPTGQWIALGVLLALNVASERWSFSRFIDRVGVLRWFDRLGTLPERRHEH